MQNSVRYYIVKTDDQPVVRSVPVMRPRAGAEAGRNEATPRIETTNHKPSVSSLLRMALRRRSESGVSS